MQEYKKITRYENYDWQKGKVDLSHLICFLLGIFAILFLLNLFLGMFIYWVLDFITIMAILWISQIKKRTYTYVKIK